MREELRRLCISPDVSIEEAARKIAEGGEKIVLIVDDSDRLLGVFVDGDLRRALIQHIPLNKPVSEVMSKSPKVCYVEDIDHPIRAKELMLEYRIEHVPVVNKQWKLVDLFCWRDFFTRPRLISHHKVVIMAGGKGSRLDPFTRILPKPLIPVGDRPIIELIMDRFVSSGFKDFILSLNYKAEMVKMYFLDGLNDYQIDFVIENMPLGTAGSLSLMRSYLKDTFFLTNCDILIDEDYTRILDYHKKNQNILTVVVSQKKMIVPYGVMEVSEDGRLKEIKEKPSYKMLVNTGFYVLEPEVLSFVPEEKPYSMVELIEDLHSRGLPIGVFPVAEDRWFDVGQWNEYRRTLKHFATLLEDMNE